ncbi:MAG TPA: CoA-binding protein [Bryobacteraceae bacterium]|nr:CoA-binding protein [Bryobacteraceae bacterium]
MVSRAVIDDFLGRRRLAVVGVSRSPKDFTRVLFREFAKRGYDVVPVNPKVDEVEGRRCYGRMEDIQPPVEGALVMTRAEVSEGVVRDCAAAGVTRVWLYRAMGKGAVSPEAVTFCREHGIAVAQGCPLMFFPKAGFPHGLHGWLLKLAGSYPK